MSVLGASDVEGIWNRDKLFNTWRMYFVLAKEDSGRAGEGGDSNGRYKLKCLLKIAFEDFLRVEGSHSVGVGEVEYRPLA